MRQVRAMVVCLVVLAILLGAIAAGQRASRRGQSEETSLGLEDFTPGLAAAREWLVVGGMAGQTFAAPPIREGAWRPHGDRGPCSNCHKILPSPHPTLTAAVRVAMPLPALPAQDGRWQGIDVMSLPPGLAREYGLAAGTQGVLVEDVTLAAADAGLWAGDLLVAIDGLSTPDLRGFLAATRRVAHRTGATLRVLRGGRPVELHLTARQGLGVAQMAGAPRIAQGSASPHRYRGACTNCHAIGPAGRLAVAPRGPRAGQAPLIGPGANDPLRWR